MRVGLVKLEKGVTALKVELARAGNIGTSAAVERFCESNGHISVLPLKLNALKVIDMVAYEFLSAGIVKRVGMVRNKLLKTMRNLDQETSRAYCSVCDSILDVILDLGF